MQLEGKQLIAGELAAEGKATFEARNPTTGEMLTPAFREATATEADRAMAAAAAAFPVLRGKTPDERAALLEAIADEVLALGDALLERAHAETGLPLPRLTGERTRTVNQTRMFAGLIREGSWVDAKIDQGDPARQPLPKPDVRSMWTALGPIVVFGASNFPLAISVVGTDTVCALGAGCPVVVKAHPGHPGTSEMLARAIAAALRKCGLPAGAFSLLQGAGYEIGLHLVRHEVTQAVAFTGSLRGGRALFDAAAARSAPIPVYAEMGSTNPVFLLPGALAQQGAQLAQGCIDSITLGVGQFCTNPGLLVGLAGEPLEGFTQSLGQIAAGVKPSTMLHAGIRDAFQAGVKRIGDATGVRVAGQSEAAADAGATQAACVVFATEAENIAAQPELTEEVFGPTSIVVGCQSRDELYQFAERLEGHLTATIHGTEQDLIEHRELVALLETKVGRIVFNGFPTGIEVCAAMHHGGPYPATTDSHFTSIGPASIYRFARPICYQNFPNAALPAELQDANPRGIWRLVDNQRTRE